MLTALFTAVSGMSANGTGLSVTGDNIANMNTVGFKSSKTIFSDLLSQSLSGASGSSQVGRGVAISGIMPQFTQGSFETSSSGLDLAIDGDGFFTVSDNGARFYTRAGQFSVNKNGFVVNPDNLVLQGYLADPTGTITGTVGDLQVGGSQSPANRTTTATISVNLDSTAVPGAAFTLDSNGDGTANDPANYNFSNSTTVYDSQGGSHQVTQYYVKTGANAWTVHYVHPDPANANLLVDAGTQALTFDVNGALVNDNSGTAINFNFGGAVATPQAIAFNYGTGTAEVPPGTGLDGTTQFASPSSISSQRQDGYAAGSLKSVNIGTDGIVTGVFTNGQTRALGQLALSRFVATTQLSKVGKNLYAETNGSGQPVVGHANTSGLGEVAPNSLELSNVDLAEEFVRMITYQRGFQANSRMITTTDQLLQGLVNL